MIIRPERPPDAESVRALNVAAFSGSDEADLVRRLQQAHLDIVSLVAEDGTTIVGHILFSRVTIHTPTSVITAVALAPMAVTPTRQRQGIGSALVRAGLDACDARGEQIVLVVGHPDYYPRFGFSTALAAPLRSLYAGPAFMALELVPDALTSVEGEVRYPRHFDAL